MRTKVVISRSLRYGEDMELTQDFRRVGAINPHCNVVGLMGDGIKSKGRWRVEVELGCFLFVLKRQSRAPHRSLL
jgi:hypothetical protein